MSIPTSGGDSLPVLLMLPYELKTAPSQRYRIEQWLPYLRQHGISFKAATLHSLREQRLLHASGGAGNKALLLLRSLVRRMLQLRLVPRCKLVWLHRTALLAGPPLIERLMARLGRPIIYEFDDAIWMTHTAESNRRWSRLKWSGKTAEICRLASRVVVGNEYLAEYARRFARQVEIVPTTVDTVEYVPVQEYRNDGAFIVGWSGSITTQSHLEQIIPILQEFSDRRSMELHAIGVPELNAWPLPHRTCSFDAALQVKRLQQFDAGIMPLPDQEWARGKCALKALEYMAVGVPVVTSPVGVNARIVRHGENGLLASTPGEWIEALTALADDEGLREKLGRAGRRTVEEGFSASGQAERVAAMIRQVAGSTI